jgi:hypothetical protein
MSFSGRQCQFYGLQDLGFRGYQGGEQYVGISLDGQLKYAADIEGPSGPHRAINSRRNRTAAPNDRRSRCIFAVFQAMAMLA